MNILSTRLPPLLAMGEIWRHPGTTVRRLLDGLSPLLLAGEVLAGPLSRYLGWKRNPDGADLEPTALELTVFTGIMALLLATLIGGVLLLGSATAREARPRGVVRAVAWGLVPILAVFPALVVLQVPPPANVGGPSTGLVVGLLSPFLWSFALLMALVAVLMANTGWNRPLTVVLLVTWFVVHELAISGVWFWFLVFATRTV